MLNTGLDCWGTVQNKTAEREIDLATFNQIVDAVTAEFDKNGLDDIRKSIRREVKDEAIKAAERIRQYGDSSYR